MRPTADSVPTILFLCVHNAGRSQMAAGFARHMGGDDIDVYSGGSEPADQVNPAAISVMAEKGIDIATHVPQRWTDAVIAATDVVGTMGCGDTCPIFPGARFIDWELDDPAGRTVEEVRLIRNDIEQRVADLLAEFEVPVPRQTN